MAKFMINILKGSGEDASHPEDDQFIMQKYQEWSKSMSQQTIFAHKLKDGIGRSLEMKSGQINDGPYSETKESIGGFYIIEADGYDQAVALAKQCPTLLYQGGKVEVREVEY